MKEGWGKRKNNPETNEGKEDVARAGYDTRSIFKQSLTGFNSEFSFF